MKEHYDDSLCEQEKLELLAVAVRVIGSILPGNTEIVLHDLRNPEFAILEIVNGHVTGRRKKDSILAGLRKDNAFINALEKSQEQVTVLKDYQTFSREGASLRSSTAIFRGRDTKPFAAVCINVDNNDVRQAVKLLQDIFGIEHGTNLSAKTHSGNEQSRDSIEDLMKEIIHDATVLNSENNCTKTKKAKLLAVQKMQERGLFMMKGGIEKAAEALGVTRYTIYNYIEKLKNNNAL
ncbi:PAS domain-containing protein [Enterobacter quasihormaechei]|uniref:PAS domain-containing protein n=1 Tax=Enterobacter quasihormaechei TaxID=2529382 RepID=A0ABU9PLJ1_9ENTR